MSNPAMHRAWGLALITIVAVRLPALTGVLSRKGSKR